MLKISKKCKKNIKNFEKMQKMLKIPEKMQKKFSEFLKKNILKSGIRWSKFLRIPIRIRIPNFAYRYPHFLEHWA